MLYATVFKLVAQHASTLPPNTGVFAHAAFMEMVRQVDSTLSAYFHDANQRKPYTVSPLMGHGCHSGEMVCLRAGQEVWIRVTLLDSELFRVLSAYLLEGGVSLTVQLSDASFSVLEALTTPGSHPRAGHTTADALFEHWTTSNSIPDTVTLNFLTPTAFQLGKWPNGQKRSVLIPDPVLIWKGLRRQWGQAGGVDPGQAHNDWVGESVGLVAHSLKTQLLSFGQYAQVGFEGWATFRAVCDNAHELAYWQALADFAFYAGVGYKTTMGMGQVRVDRDD